MSKTKIMYIVSSLKRSGPIRVLYGIIKHMPTDQFVIQILTLSPEPADTMRGEFETLNVQIIALDLPRVAFIALGLRRAITVIRAEKPEVIHAHSIRADLIAALLNMSDRRNTLSTVHNSPFEDYSYSLGRWWGQVIAVAHLMILRRLRHVVACSRYVADRISNRAKCIQNGIDIECFAPSEDGNKGKLTIIMVGHLSQRKDPGTAIEGFLRSRFNADGEAQLLIVGNGEYYDELRHAHLLNDNVHFLGRRTDINGILQNGHYFISASHAEGLPNAALEALACGLPLILSDIPPHQEIQRSAPASCTLFRTGDPESLAQALDALDETQYHAAAKAAREAALMHFSAEAMSAQYQQTYLQIAKEKL